MRGNPIVGEGKREDRLTATALLLTTVLVFVSGAGVGCRDSSQQRKTNAGEDNAAIYRASTRTDSIVRRPEPRAPAARRPRRPRLAAYKHREPRLPHGAAHRLGRRGAIIRKIVIPQGDSTFQGATVGGGLLGIEHNGPTGPVTVKRFQLPDLTLTYVQKIRSLAWATDPGWSCMADLDLDSNSSQPVRIFDLDTWNLFPRLRPNPARLDFVGYAEHEAAVAISVNCERVAAPLGLAWMGVWNVKTGRLIQRIRAKQSVTRLPGTGRVLVLRNSGEPTRAWFVRTGSELRVASGDAIERILSGMGELVVAQLKSGSRLYDGRTGKRLTPGWLFPDARILALHPRRPWVALRYQQKVYVVDATRGRQLLVHSLQSPVAHAHFVEQGGRLVLVTKKRIRLVQISDGAVLFEHSYRVDGKLEVHTGAQGEIVGLWSVKDHLTGSPSSRHLLTLDCRTARRVPLGHVRDPRPQPKVKLSLTPADPGSWLGAVGRFIVTHRDVGGRMHLIWDRRTGELLNVNGERFVNQPTTIRFSPDSHKIAVSTGSTVDLYSVADGQKWHTLTDATEFEFTSDGKAMVIAGEELRLWDMASRSTKYRVENGCPFRVNLSPDGRWARCLGVVTASDDTSTKLRLHKDAHFVETWGGVIDPTSRFLALSWSLTRFAGRTREYVHYRVTLIELAHPERRRHLWTHKSQPIGQLTFRPDGSLIGEGVGRHLIWSPPYRATPRTGPRIPKAAVATAIRPDGSLLVLLKKKKSVYEVWLHKAGGRRRKLSDIQLANISLATFSPDGRTLATTEQDTAVLLWRLPK